MYGSIQPYTFVLESHGRVRLIRPLFPMIGDGRPRPIRYKDSSRCPRVVRTGTRVGPQRRHARVGACNGDASVTRCTCRLARSSWGARYVSACGKSPASSVNSPKPAKSVEECRGVNFNYKEKQKKTITITKNKKCRCDSQIIYT